MTRQKAQYSRHARPSSSRRHHSNGHRHEASRPSYSLLVEADLDAIGVDVQEQQNPAGDVVFQGNSLWGGLNGGQVATRHPMADLASEGRSPPRHHPQEQRNEHTPSAVSCSSNSYPQSLEYSDPSPMYWNSHKPRSYPTELDAEGSPPYRPKTPTDDSPTPLQSDSGYSYTTGVANIGLSEYFAPGALGFFDELSCLHHDDDDAALYPPTQDEGASSPQDSVEAMMGSAAYVYYSPQYPTR